MFIKLFQKTVLYTRELQELGLFTLMADSAAFSAFSGTPMYFIVLPFLAALLTLQVVINAYQLLMTHNKNFDQWFIFIVSLISATLSSISLYGSVLAQAYSFSFAAGPWFYFSSVSLVLGHQLTMLWLNLYRAYESQNHSAQGMHYIQAALSNLFNAGLLLAIMGAVTFVMLFPHVAPIIGVYSSLAAVGFTSANILWRLTPYVGKQAIKELLQLGKPQDEVYEKANYSERIQQEASDALAMQQKYSRLFTAIDYKADFKKMKLDAAKAKLEDIIKVKINHLRQSPQTSEKNNQKIIVLSQLQGTIAKHTTLSKESIAESYPLAFQSFRMEKGEVEQLFDAALALDERYKHNVHMQIEEQFTP